MASESVKKHIPSLEYEGDHGSIYNTWTATFDGIGIAIVEFNTNNTAGYWYIKDTTANIRVVALETANAKGLSASAAFPIIKGHTYDGTQDTAALSTVHLYAYKFK